MSRKSPWTRGGSGSPRSTNRRGATLVLFALLLVPLLTIAAMAVDASLWQVGANQLQVTADAAALAGARAAQLYPGTAGSPGAATSPHTYATNTAAANVAFSSPVTITNADVEPYWWDPVGRTASPRTWATNDYNAVKVTTRATGGRILSGIVRSSGVPVTRSAIAWIANINSSECIKPWALPYTVFYDAVVAATGLSSTIPPTLPSTNPPYRNDLSQEQIAAMNLLTNGNQNVQQRTVIMRGPTTSSVNWPASGAFPAVADVPAINQWMGYNFNGNAGSSYQGAVGACDATAAVGANSGATLPGANDIECYTIAALIGGNTNVCQNNGNYLTDYTCNGGGTQGCPTNRTCVFSPNTGSGSSQTAHAECYDPLLYPVTCVGANCSVSIPVGAGAQPGKEVNVVWGDGTGTGSNLTSYRQVGKFKIYCVFRAYSQGTSTVPRTPVNNVIGETCSVPGGLTYTNLPAGTIIGVIGTIGLDITSGTTLGNTHSLAQRLILVQ
jgi:Flp pilus assembly protein TadG